LALVFQGIKKIEGLQSCLELEQVWLLENKISRIQGLDHLTCLRELYLYSNQLTAIEGIAKLTTLTVSLQPLPRAMACMHSR
jgi:Leucine-rich repeat (LRR) protein